MRVVYSTVIEDGRRKRKGIVLWERKCKVCGKQYQPSRKDALICSGCSGSRGKGSYIKVGSKRRWVILEQRKCRECGNGFQPKTQKSLYCSKACGNKAERDRSSAKNRERSKEWYHNNIEEARKKRKERYWSNPDKYRAYSKSWREEHPEEEKELRDRTKDRLLHGGRRKGILEQSNYICSVCGKDTRSGWRDSCVHHETFDSTDHDNQVLVCRNCHTKIHKKLG